MWTGTSPHYTISTHMRASHAAMCAVVFAATALTAQPERRAISLIVEGGTVVTVNSERRIFLPGFVAIDGNTIIDVDAYRRRRPAGDQQALSAIQSHRRT